MAKQITITGEELWAKLPDGNLPDTIKVKGIDFTVEQIDKICHTLDSGLLLSIQRLAKQRLAVRTYLMPPGVWAVYEADGEFKITPEYKDGQ